MKSKLFLTLMVGLAILIAGCAKAPDAEIASAKSAMEALRAAEADLYAPQALKMAMDTLSAADAAKTEADGKFALFRSYNNAKALYVSAEALANSAAEEAAAEKEKMRVMVMEMHASAMQQLAEADSALAKAPVGKGNKADIEVLKSDLASIHSGLNTVQQDIDSNHYVVARTKLQSAMERIGNVQAEIAKATAKKK